MRTLQAILQNKIIPQKPKLNKTQSLGLSRSGFLCMNKADFPKIRVEKREWMMYNDFIEDEINELPDGMN